MNTNLPENRLHALDAVRGFALLLGVAFHAALSFMPGWPPGIWAMVDNSPSPFLSDAAFVTHVFRMSLFFFIAGFFGRMMYHKLGARQFLGEPRQAHPGAADRGLDHPGATHHVHLDHRHRQGTRRPAPGPAGNAEKLVPAHSPLVSLSAAAAVRGGHRAARDLRAPGSPRRSCAHSSIARSRHRSAR